MIKRLKVLEEKLEKKEEVEKGRRDAKVDENKKVRGKLECRIKKIERNLESKEREDRRRRNMIIKGVQKEKDDWR